MSDAIAIISPFVAVSAFVLAIVNFVRTSRLSSRQYYLAMKKPIIEWATDVIDTQHDLFSINDEETIDEKRKALRSLGKKILVQETKGSLIIFENDRDVAGMIVPWDKHPVIASLIELRLYTMKLAESPDFTQDTPILKGFGGLYGRFAHEVQTMIHPKRGQ